MKILLLSLALLTAKLLAQINLPENLVGTHKYDSQNGMILTTNPIPSNSLYKIGTLVITKDHSDSNASYLRYIEGDPYGIGYNCSESGNGLYSVIGWGFLVPRISLFGNSSNTPLWNFPTANALYNYVSISNKGDYIAAGSLRNIYLLNRVTGNPVFNFDLTTLHDAGAAGPVAVTGDGSFLIGTAVRSEMSTIFGFRSSSNIPLWRYTVPTSLYGVKISGNDSLIIINTYSLFWVLKTYSGELVFQGSINPVDSSGTQNNQGISGNGNIIATINNSGYLRVYQWNGSTYNFLWQYWEPPGAFYNWVTAVDVSFDGSMIACGTLNFLTSSTYDGKVRFFNTANGSTPVWTYNGCGDEVNSVSFSRSGRILSAASWGDVATHTANNLLVFNTAQNSNTPIYSVNDFGSFFSCSTSDDGQTVIASGKQVHARETGYGGMFYNVFIDTSNNPIGIHNDHNSLPIGFKLSQNYPNPFNPETKIKFSIRPPLTPLLGKEGTGLPAETSVQAGVVLKIYDLLGRDVETLISEKLQPGTYEVEWNAANYPSGVYFYKLQSGIFTDTKKMTLIK